MGHGKIPIMAPVDQILLSSQKAFQLVCNHSPNPQTSQRYGKKHRYLDFIRKVVNTDMLFQQVSQLDFACSKQLQQADICMKTTINTKIKHVSTFANIIVLPHDEHARWVPQTIKLKIVPEGKCSYYD
jgi:hypothetical protein